MKMKIQLFKMCWMPGKQWLEGSWETLNACIRKEDSFPINTLSFYPRIWWEKKSKLNSKQENNKDRNIIN